jgi:Uma2 family endonuclease
MATAAQTKLMTAEEFMAAGLGDDGFELVRGEVVRVPPTMPQHGRVCSRINWILETFGRTSGFGYPLSESAVATERGPDTVRGPDVSFYSHARWPESEVGTGLPPVPPDLVVEVVSPSNRPGEMQRKVTEYLEAGVLLVLIVDPARRKAALYRLREVFPTILSENDVLENLPELPGFTCPLADFFIPVSKGEDGPAAR